MGLARLRGQDGDEGGVQITKEYQTDLDGFEDCEYIADIESKFFGKLYFQQNLCYHDD
jgi:hypothetical protein